MEAELRAALERAVAALERAAGEFAASVVTGADEPWNRDTPVKAPPGDSLNAHRCLDAAREARAALAASPASVRDGGDLERELREARAIAGLALTFIPADQFPHFEEKCKAILLDPAALAVHRPVREPGAFRVLDKDGHEMECTPVFGVPARGEAAWWDEHQPTCAPHRVQVCEVGPWQDVTDEGDGA